MKLNPLTRPLSSHKDPDAGFSFTKAKPRQQLDFSRKPKQDPTTHANKSSIPLPLAAETLPFRIPLPASSVAQPAERSTTAVDLSNQAPNAVNSLFVPFPNLHSPVSFEHELAAGKTTARGRSSPSGHPIDEATVSANATFGGSNFNDESYVHQQQTHDTYHPRKCSPRDISHNAQRWSRETYHAPVNSPKQTSCHSQKAIRKPPTGPPDPAQIVVPGSKVTKHRNKKLTISREGYGSVTSHGLFVPGESNEEMLLQLMDRIRKDRREREATEAALEASNRQCQMFVALSSDLDAKLYDTTKLCSEKEAQLSKIKAAKPGWEIKIKKLGEYVQGLTNDHNRLRDDARDIREQSDSVLKERKSLHDALHQVSEMTTAHASKSREFAIEAQHNLELLQRNVQNQQSDLHNEQELLVIERERNIQLQGQISKFAAGATSQEHLTESLLQHRRIITEKIENFLEKAKVNSTNAPEDPQDRLRPMLEQCLNILTHFQNHDIARPGSYEKLENLMRNYLGEISQSIELSVQNSTTMEADHQQLVSLMQEQLRDLRSNIATDSAFSEQIMDLRELKATLIERLQGTESALRDTRVESIAFKQKIEDQQRKMLKLEADAKGSTGDVVMLSRLQELESQNRALQQSIVCLQTEKVSLSAQLQQNDEDAQGLQQSLIKFQAQVQEARHEIKAVRQEKEDLEKSALQQIEKIKREHVSTIEQMKAKESPAENKLSQATKQSIILQAEKENAEKEACILTSALERLQKDRQHEAAFADRLRARVMDLENQQTEQEATNKSLREELAGNNEDMKVKDAYIKHLQARDKGPQVAHDKRPHQLSSGLRSKPVTQASNASRSKHCTPRPMSALVEDFQFVGPPNNVEQPVTEADLDLLSDSPLARYETLLLPDPPLQQNGNAAGMKLQTCASHQERLRDAHSARSGAAQSNGTPGRHATESKSQSSISQLPAHDSAVMPRRIVKNSRAGKRDVSGAGFNDLDRRLISKRVKSSVTRPVTIKAPPQQPSHILSNQIRTQTKTRKRNLKDDQMKSRFSQELRHSEDL